MPITLGSNIASLSAMRQLGSATQKNGATLERLSSGRRIVRASDDAAGLAIAEALNSRQRVLTQGMRNISDGQSFLSVTEGALRSLTDISIRMRELAIQAANGSVSRAQRLALQNESDKLVEEFNRVVSSTQFNGINVLDGNTTAVRVQAGYGISGGLDTALTSGLARAKGTGTFGTASSALGSPGSDTLVLDLNGDGNNDVVSASALAATIFYRNGDGSGAIGASETTVTNATAVTNSILAAGDVDGDGDTDVIGMGISSGQSRTYITTYLNSSGTLSVGSQFSVASSTTSGFQVTDINGDSRADVLLFASTLTGVQTYSPGILYHLGQSNGSLGSSSTLIGTSSGQSVTFDVGDYTGDGRADVLYANTLTGSVNLGVGNGAGGISSSTAVTNKTVVSNIKGGDFNRDGLRDFTFSQFNPVSEVGELVTGLSRGNGTFSFTTSASEIMPTEILDMDNDGLLDVVGVGGSVVEIAFGNGDGSFDSGTTASLSASPTSFGDLNNDGVLDAVSSASRIQRWLHSTSNTTSAQYVTLVTAEDARSALATIDGNLNRISKELGIVGAAMSRLQSAYQTVAAERENSTAAASRIVDADIASESAQLTRTQIAQRAAQAVLAQANQIPSLALILLKS